MSDAGILVDTSAWIELLRRRRSETAGALERLIVTNAPLVTTGLVVAELLRGCSSEGDARLLRGSLLAFRAVEPSYPTTYELAARLHRDARRQGHSIRSTVDCVIAALAVEHGFVVMHRDRDYGALARIGAIVELAAG